MTAIAHADILTSCCDRVVHLRTTATETQPDVLRVDLDEIQRALRLHARYCPEV